LVNGTRFAALPKIAATSGGHEVLGTVTPGIEAKLMAEAAGKKEIAAALNAYSADAARLLMLPDVLASVVKATEAAATPLPNSSGWRSSAKRATPSTPSVDSSVSARSRLPGSSRRRRRPASTSRPR
jgi:flotillin